MHNMNSMEQSRSQEANSRLATQEMRGELRRLKALYEVH
jgi:hypothetical protein